MESIDFVHGSGRELLPGTIPPELSLLTCLTTLVLTFKDGTIPTELGLLTKLRRLELISGGFGGSSIKGSIPTEIGMMTALTSISFPQGLNGTLPSEIGRLTGLTALFLNKTDFCYHWEECFQGTIPSEIGLLSGLESLELGNNMLGGLLPSELGLLTSLLSFGHSCQVSCDRHNGTFSELGNLAALEYMTVAYNGGLTGPLPTELRVIPCIYFTRITFSRWCMKEPRLVSADGYNRELCWGGQSTETPYFCPKGVSNSTL
ncbi:LRR receptor-like serine threonine-protein kinase [Seminavis robusta]|uniref:LRR receptor-like serine threonine-protein kinase n=1 Tax=Seminavis robusta TaxID=568900 RepID=A0A9N8EZM4_9STRA|nr:LRR receptor-like serine threonine-protein kinase [Seminavis robusta]|eukprot:Sro2113_g315070.1 LRR receptor-like serine threonine-protein kinase (261) ;mRNA; r:12281-13150